MITNTTNQNPRINLVTTIKAQEAQGQRERHSMNQQTQSEQRRCLELESAALFGLLQDASVQAIFAGIQPTEVWLGPKEARILEVEMNWQSAEGRLVHTNANQSAMIRGDMEGAQLKGLRVRLMAKDGVRVGISWPTA